MDKGGIQTSKRHKFLDAEFERGETVYLKTDIEQLPRIVVGYLIMQGVEYGLICGEVVTYHNAFEISREVNISLIFEDDDEEDI